MLIYFVLYAIIIAMAAARYKPWVNYVVFPLIFSMLAFKGAVGCDYHGYFNHYITYEAGKSILDLRGEVTWYYIESLVYQFRLDYQWYYIISGAIATYFLLRSQKYSLTLGLLVLIYPIIFIQLGLSGIRQFLAVCIMIYIASKYFFKPQASLWPFVFFTLLAATFHVSALFMLIVLPFLYKLKPAVVITLFLISAVAVGSSFAEEVYSTYESRYVADRTRTSSGAWIRFIVTAFFLFVGGFHKKGRYKNLSLLLLALGLLIGVFNSIALHRMNYFLYPIACLIFLDRVKQTNNQQLLWLGYGVAVSYMVFWFFFSTHSDCLIPYHFFFQMGQ